jgi:hypothetical protein
MRYGETGNNLEIDISPRKTWLVNYFFFPVDKHFSNCYINHKAEIISINIKQEEQPYK